MNSSGSSIKMNSSTCMEIVDLREYEYRLVMLYESFIKIYLDLIECVNKEEKGISVKEEVGAKNLDLSIEKMVTEKQAFYECFQNFEINNTHCLQVCKEKKISQYEFPIKIFETFKEAGHILFYEFVKEDFEDYY